jgi:hypothetical protein
MKKQLIPATLAALLIAIAVLPSCKKDERDPTRSEQIIGTWKTVEQGVDSNTNGNWDQSERMAVPASDEQIFTFSSDGKGSISGAGVGFTIPYTWSFLNNESDLQIIASAFGTTDTLTQHIVSFDGTNAILQDASETPNLYFNVKKQ